MLLAQITIMIAFKLELKKKNEKTINQKSINLGILGLTVNSFSKKKKKEKKEKKKEGLTVNRPNSKLNQYMP